MIRCIKTILAKCILDISGVIESDRGVIYRRKRDETDCLSEEVSYERQVFSILLCLALGRTLIGAAEGALWSVQKSQTWYAKQPWLVGCNFIPSTAINQLEMWQADTFDPQTIDRELNLAAGIGMNFVRVYLHDLLWEQDSQGFISRIDEFLAIADKHQIKVMFVLLDGCWDPHRN